MYGEIGDGEIGGIPRYMFEWGFCVYVWGSTRLSQMFEFQVFIHRHLFGQGYTFTILPLVNC